MLNEAPKKKKNIDYAEPTRWQLFWRVQREGWRRMVSPFFMYLFMSTLALAIEAIVPGEAGTPVEIALGSICIAGGAAFNAHLLFNTGKLHYDAYLTGCIHRRNRALGIMSGGDHRVEREYRVWKGFLIGFFIGVPAIVLGLIAGIWPDSLAGPSYFFMAMFTGWAIFPIVWARASLGLEFVSGYWSLLMVLMPILVSGIAYIVGAYVEKDKKDKEAERREEVQAAGTESAGKKGKKKT